jgi:hypothetical protein
MNVWDVQDVVLVVVVGVVVVVPAAVKQAVVTA